MTSIFVLSLLLGFLFGGMMLALVMGYVSTEQERAEDEQTNLSTALVARMTATEHFFANANNTRGLRRDDAGDDAMVNRLEDYLREEQAVVARFVNEPSVDNLYRQTPASALIH
jgi:hypothetical protein